MINAILRILEWITGDQFERIGELDACIVFRHEDAESFRLEAILPNGRDDEVAPASVRACTGCMLGVQDPGIVAAMIDLMDAAVGELEDSAPDSLKSELARALDENDLDVDAEFVAGYIEAALQDAAACGPGAYAARKEEALRLLPEGYEILDYEGTDPAPSVVKV